VRHLALTLLSAVLAAAPLARADDGAAAHDETLEPLMDNSFLIEEAYNQEEGVVQHILLFVRGSGGGWVASFTQEWPVPGQAHQLSYTLSGGKGAATGFGDLLLNYRYQAVFNDRVAFAPRLTAVLATASADSGASYHGNGWQAMLPLSLTLTPWLVSHTNLGGTWLPRGSDGGATGQLTTLTAGQSLIWLATPRFNVLLEAVWTSIAVTASGATAHRDLFVVSPGVRKGFDFAGDLQVVLGLAAPLGVGPSAGEKAILGYLSVELPFWHPRGGD
jgi:hypothetical protein